MQPESSAIQRCGFVALVGPTNAGKSTLLNRLLDLKTAAVSRKINTTRHRIRGILTREQSQIVLVDTPGFSGHKRTAAPQHIAPEESANADTTLLLLDARHVLHEQTLTQRVIKDFVQQPVPNLCVGLNKIDTLSFDKRLLATQKLADSLPAHKVFLISALHGQGTDDMLQYWQDTMPVGPWFYAANQLTDLPLKLIAADMIREHIYDRLHDELPYVVTPVTDTITYKNDGSLVVHQTIYVPNVRYKPLLIGKNGQMLKLLGERGRHSLSQHVGKPVHLFLNIKVREKVPDMLSEYA